MSRKAPYVVIALAAWALGVAWALTSPVGSSPDEDFHLSSIYCLSGDDALCRDLDGPGPSFDSEVPAQLNSHNCYAFRSEQSAACTQALADDATALTERFNHSGDYPPTFYAFLSIFAGQDVPAAVLLMRVVALTVALGAMALAALANPQLRDSQLVAWCFASIPLGMFMLASVNPSGWAIAGVAALWPAAHAMFHAQRTGAFVLAAVASVVAAVLATARADSAGMAAGVLGLVLLAYARKRSQIPAMIASALLIVVLGWIFLKTGGGQNLVVAPEGQPGGLWNNLVQLPRVWAGNLGTTGLGWLDTPMPALVWVLASGAVAALLLVGIRRLGIVRLLVLVGVGAAMAAYPLAVLRASNPDDGFWFQSRYALPLMLAFVGISLSPTDGPRWNLSVPQRWALALVATIATAIALHAQLRRYVTGTDIAVFHLNFRAEWSPLPWLSPMALWVIGSVLGAVLFAAVTHLVRQPREESDDTVARPGPQPAAGSASLT